MKRDFLRPPRTVAEYAADAMRVIGVLSVLVAAVWSTPTDAGVLAFSLPALMLPRALGLRGGADLAVGVIILVAAGSNVFDLYRSLPGWDLVVHFLCTGAIAATGYVVLSRLGIVPGQASPLFRPRIPLVICTTVGLAVSAVREIGVGGPDVHHRGDLRDVRGHDRRYGPGGSGRSRRRSPPRGRPARARAAPLSGKLRADPQNPGRPGSVD